MDVKRVILGSNPRLSGAIRIPDMCQHDKTITVNQYKVMTIFKDYRPTARKFIDEFLPLTVIGIQPEKIRQLFWEMPQNGWMEFDVARKTLSFCYVEKK